MYIKAGQLDETAPSRTIKATVAPALIVMITAFLEAPTYKNKQTLQLKPLDHLRLSQMGAAKCVCLRTHGCMQGLMYG